MIECYKKRGVGKEEKERKTDTITDMQTRANRQSEKGCSLYQQPSKVNFVEIVNIFVFRG